MATVQLTPCLRCGEPHSFDEKRGWRAPDGHAYLRDPHPPKPQLDTVGVNGWTPIDFGMSARCPLCAAKVGNTRADIDAHEAWHAGQTVSA